MASSPDEQSHREDGYATAAAAMISLAISLVVTAVVASSLTDLRLSRAAFEKGRAEAALSGVQDAAVVALLQTEGIHRYRWTISSAVGPVEVLAEPETPKIPAASALTATDGELRGLGAQNPERLRARLRALRVGAMGALDLAGLDSSPRWRTCAASVISPYGAGAAAGLTAAGALRPGPFSWRGAEMWRLKAVSKDGWADERIVRFTADTEQPAAIVERRFVRGQMGGEPCQALIDASV